MTLWAIGEIVVVAFVWYLVARGIYEAGRISGIVEGWQQRDKTAQIEIDAALSEKIVMAKIKGEDLT